MSSVVSDVSSVVSDVSSVVSDVSSVVSDVSSVVSSVVSSSTGFSTVLSVNSGSLPTLTVAVSPPFTTFPEPPFDISAPFNTLTVSVTLPSSPSGTSVRFQVTVCVFLS